MLEGEKRYTIPEANELLAHLAPTLTELRSKFDRAIEIQKKIEEGALTNGGSGKREEWSKLLARVQELLERVHDWELQIRDVDEGLVDFPAEIDGGPAWLCWKLGEPRVAFWHRPDEGFANRKPL
jgi:hypothetical protein